MALFQRRPAVNSVLPAYTVGSSRSILMVGLGNPGKKFEQTRHNIGFKILDYFAGQHDFPTWANKKDLRCELTMAQIGSSRVILAKPTTFMNDSGQAVAQIAQFYKLQPSDTLVIYDELAIPFGQLRTRIGGSDAGHNGVKSVIAHIGDGFGRLRVGIGPQKPEGIDAADFVLAKFSKGEQAQLNLIIREADVLLTEFIYSGQLPHDTRNVL